MKSCESRSLALERMLASCGKRVRTKCRERWVGQDGGDERGQRLVLPDAGNDQKNLRLGRRRRGLARRVPAARRACKWAT